MQYNRPMRNRFRILVLGLLMCGAAGCNVVGLAATKLPPPIVKPAYEELAGQSVAVVVWCESQVDLDHPTLARQVGSLLQENLEVARDDGNRRTRRTLEDTTFPFPASAYVKYFKEDPSLASVPGPQLAPRMGADRVIFVEIGSFTTRGGASPGLVRGVAELDVAVYEVPQPIGNDDASPAGRTQEVPPAVEVYREPSIVVMFPKDGEGEPELKLRPDQAYTGLVIRTAGEVAKRFVPHTAEE